MMLKDQKWRIWHETYDDEGNLTGSGVYHKEYAYYETASNMAYKLYGDKPNFKYKVAMRNPWVEYTRTLVCSICGSDYEAKETVNGGHVITNMIEIYNRAYPREDERHMYLHRPCPACTSTVVDFIENLRAKESKDA